MVEKKFCLHANGFLCNSVQRGVRDGKGQLTLILAKKERKKKQPTTLQGSTRNNGYYLGQVLLSGGNLALVSI